MADEGSESRSGNHIRAHEWNPRIAVFYLGSDPYILYALGDYGPSFRHCISRNCRSRRRECATYRLPYPSRSDSSTRLPDSPSQWRGGPWAQYYNSNSRCWTAHIRSHLLRNCSCHVHYNFMIFPLFVSPQLRSIEKLTLTVNESRSLDNETSLLEYQ